MLSKHSFGYMTVSTIGSKLKFETRKCFRKKISLKIEVLEIAIFMQKSVITRKSQVCTSSIILLIRYKYIV